MWRLVQMSKSLKFKKQFRLFDLYRYASTGEQSNIFGVESYECNDDCTTIVVRYMPSLGGSCNYFCVNEFERKQIVKTINERLGNCRKPGKKKHEA